MKKIKTKDGELHVGEFLLRIIEVKFNDTTKVTRAQVLEYLSKTTDLLNNPL